MAIEISELHPDDHDQVLAMWPKEAADDRPDPNRLMAGYSSLSVVAREEGKIVAVALCERAANTYQQWVAVADSHREGGLSRPVIDKALLKMQAVGITRCLIRLMDDAGQAAFWESVRWSPDASCEPSKEQVESDAE